MGEMRALIWCAVSSDAQMGEDKVSLAEQERAARAWCDENGYDVVAVLTVPGESRSDSDVLGVFEEFASKGIYAYHDLRRMWSERAFDVLVAYHDSRLGRSASLLTYVIENVMRSGARIYCIHGGWYNKDDYKFKAAVSSISAGSEIERFTALSRATHEKKASEGRLIRGRIPYSHTWQYDERGKKVRKILDENKRYIIEAAARIVCEGVGWLHVEHELFARYGYSRDGKPFPRKFFYFLFHHPNFWGNEAIGWDWKSNGKGKRNTKIGGQQKDLWVFDPSYPPKPEMKIWYDVMPAYLTGELADALKAELRRRRKSIRGSARPFRSKKFSGLLVCYYCGRRLVYSERRQAGENYVYRTYYCNSKKTSQAPDRCLVQRRIRESVVQAWFDRELRAALSEHAPEWFLRREDTGQARAQLEGLERAAGRLETAITNAIDEQIHAGDTAVRLRYRSRIGEMTGELDTLRRQIDNLKADANEDRSAVMGAYSKIATFPDLTAFWESGDRVVNQLLHALLCGRVIVIKDQEVVGSADG